MWLTSVPSLIMCNAPFDPPVHNEEYSLDFKGPPWFTNRMCTCTFHVFCPSTVNVCTCSPHLRLRVSRSGPLYRQTLSRFIISESRLCYKTIATCQRWKIMLYGVTSSVKYRRTENSKSKERKTSEAVQSQEDKSCCIIIQDTEVDPKLPNHMKKTVPTAATTEYNTHI